MDLLVRPGFDEESGFQVPLVWKIPAAYRRINNLFNNLIGVRFLFNNTSICIFFLNVYIWRCVVNY